MARKAGVSEEQLTRIGRVAAGGPSSSTAFTSAGSGQLTPLQAAAVSYADAMTASVSVSDATFDTLKEELKKAEQGQGQDAEAKINQKLVEASGTVAAYNMVSRFLVALDIDDRAKQPVPVPGLEQELKSEDNQLNYPTPAPDSTSGQAASGSRGLVQVRDGITLATRVHFHSMQAPWIVLVNSLMTNVTMWDRVVPALSQSFNVVCYDQRGHGASAVPADPCTVEGLADDIADILSALGVDKCRAVVGVSQGGATALSFALRHPDRADRVVANDTQASSPEANFKAWEDRIALAHKEGMQALANATVDRWYGSGSAGDEETKHFAHSLISSTDVRGFEQGARALQKYDLVSAGLIDALTKKPTLLVAGEADGALPKGLAALADKVRQTGDSQTQVDFKSIPKAAHLPMLDNPQGWLDAVLPFLQDKVTKL